MSHKIWFIEAGDGDPSHRYENARLGLALSQLDEGLVTSINPLSHLSRAEAPRGRIWLNLAEPGILCGARNFQGYLLGVKNDPFELPPLNLSKLSVKETGIRVKTLPLSRATDATNALLAEGMEVGIHDTEFPDMRYKVLSGRQISPDYLPSDLSAMRDEAKVHVNLIARPAEATAERRFFFVDGQLISDSPVAFGMEFWREDVARTGSHPDTFGAKGAFRYSAGWQPTFARSQRSFATEIAQELGMISGYIDVQSHAGKPWFTGAHQSHIGDFSLYGADIRALAEASFDHLKRLTQDCDAAPSP